MVSFQRPHRATRGDAMTCTAARLAAATGGLLLLGTAAGAPVAAVAAERGVYWEQTVQMEMVGMPMAMPAHTMKVCMPVEQWSRPPQDQKDKNCEAKEVKQSGQTMTWKMVCTGEHPMTGDGELTRSGDTFKGRTHMVMAQGEMNMKFSGKKLGGDCDPGELKRNAEAMKEKAQAQQADAAARMAEMERVGCDAAMKEMQVRAVAGQSPACRDPAKKAEFCARLRTGRGYRLVLGQGEMEKATSGAMPGPKAAAQACGVNLDQVKSELCAKGEKVDSLDFLAEHCPEQAKVLAMRECSGRDYTAMAGSRYGSFCAKAWDGSQEAKAEPKVKPKADPKDAAVDQGKKALKGLLGF
jgi:hypothetical protein